MPPRRQAFSDVPIQVLAGVDTVQGIQSILATHDRGYFQASAQLWDAMKRDDRIFGTTGTRVGALMAAPLEIKPASSKAKAARVQEALAGDGEDDHGLWERICPPDTIESLSDWGNGIGLGLAQIIWQTSAGEWLPRLKVWHPQFVYWDTADNRYMVVAREGIAPLPRIDETPEGDGNWVVWTPYGYQYGYLKALVRALADKYMMRGWDYRDWARSCERQGMATFGAMVPAGAPEDVKNEFVDHIRTLGSDAVLELPQLEGDEGGFDLKMIESTTRNWETFLQFKKELDVDIAIAVLGQNLTTEAGTDGGSRAATQVQNLLRIDRAIKDAGIADCIRQQVLTWWALYNYGDPDLAPRPEYQVEPPEDEVQESTALKTLGEALGSLKTAGAPIDVRTILDRAGVPMISEEEEAAQKAIAEEEAQARLEAMQAAGPPTANDNSGGEGRDDSPGPPAGAKRPPAAGSSALSASTRTPLPPPVKRYEFQGLPIAVENPVGTIRMWHQPGPNGGVLGSTTMAFDYGYIEGHLSGDDEELDVYIGPDPNARFVYNVHQRKAPDFRCRDEDKVFLGFGSADEAKAAYLHHRKDEAAFGGMSTIPLEEFRRKLKRRTGTGPIRATALEAQVQHRETTEALVRLADRVAVSLKATPRTAAGRKRAKLYSDEVADRAKRLAARALAVDLRAIREEVDACTGFEDLRRRLAERYKEMDPKRLAEVVERARIMSHLGGRVTAVKDV